MTVWSSGNWASASMKAPVVHWSLLSPDVNWRIEMYWTLRFATSSHIQETNAESTEASFTQIVNGAVFVSGIFDLFTARKRSLGKVMFYTYLWFCSHVGLCPGWGSSVQRVVSVQGGFCPGGPLSGGVSVRETPHIVKSGQYASYWNAFLFDVMCKQHGSTALNSFLNGTENGTEKNQEFL